MTIYVALLRGINVGGSGRLLMSDLVALCRGIGVADVQTYIQSGNVVFTSELSEKKIKERLETALAEKMNKAVGVRVRSCDEFQAVLKRNPFQAAAPNQVLVLFLDKAPPAGTLAGVIAPDGEQVHVAGREVYVHYPKGMGRSKLKLPLVDVATGRNINTVVKLAQMAAQLAAR